MKCETLQEKSAEAAKNTTQLIIQTIEAVADSTKIAHTAASAMNEVVAGANSIIAELNEISKMSSEQSNAISQITIGIEQISSVVSTNSASAEETSAAVNVFSSQAKIMEKKLKDLNFLKNSKNWTYFKKYVSFFLLEQVCKPGSVVNGHLSWYTVTSIIMRFLRNRTSHSFYVPFCLASSGFT